MPTLKYRIVKGGDGLLSDSHAEAYWEPDTLPTPAASQTQAPTNDELKPNDELNLIKKKKRRGLTVPLAAVGTEGSLSSVLASIGLNIPT
jgi:hypothetical protein